MLKSKEVVVALIGSITTIAALFIANWLSKPAATTTPVPTTQTKEVPAETRNPSKVQAPAPRTTQPVTAKPQAGVPRAETAASETQTPKPTAQIINTAPQGIVVSGGTVTNPVVNNYSQPTKSLPAEVVLTSGEAKTLVFNWVPDIDATPRISPGGVSGYPALSLRNLSDDPVTSCSLSWEAEGPAVADYFATSKHFQRFNPQLSDSMFWLTNKSGRGAGVPVKKQETTYVPFVGKEPVAVDIPPGIWNHFALRMIDTIVRPERPSEINNGFKETKLRLGTVTLTYKQGDSTQERKFTIGFAVIAVHDSDYQGGSATPQIPLEAWSPDNLRAILRPEFR